MSAHITQDALKKIPQITDSEDLEKAISSAQAALESFLLSVEMSKISGKYVQFSETSIKLCEEFNRYVAAVRAEYAAALISGPRQPAPSWAFCTIDEQN